MGTVPGSWIFDRCLFLFVLSFIVCPLIPVFPPNTRNGLISEEVPNTHSILDV